MLQGKTDLTDWLDNLAKPLRTCFQLCTPASQVFQRLCLLELILRQRIHKCHVLCKHSILWMNVGNHSKANRCEHQHDPALFSSWGFSPEIDWPTECHADPGASGVFQSMALECIWCCTATCILNWIWWRVETMWIGCMVINEAHIEQGHSDSHEFECRAITWVGSLAVASGLNSKILCAFLAA